MTLSTSEIIVRRGPLAQVGVAGREPPLGGNLARFGHANVYQGFFAEGMVAAIAAAAGLDVSLPRLGHRIDMMVYKPGVNGTSGSRQINLQVKSWSQGALHDDGSFHYPLEVPAYKYLAGSGHDVRHYLVLCLVPDDAARYADAQRDRLSLFESSYWLSLRDVSPDPSLNDNSTKTVYVPSTNLLTMDTIRALVDGDETQAVAP